MPYLLREQFPGATGATWPAQWAQAASATGSSATQQGLKGRLASGTLTAYNGSHAMYAVIAAKADAGVALTFNAAAVVDDYTLETWLRCTTNSSFDSGTGYFIQITPSLGQWTLNKAVSFVYTQLGTTQTKTFSAATDYRLRIQAIGTTVRARVWTASVSEPTTWDISVTDSAISAAGSIVINFHGGNTGTDTIDLKNILIDDGNFDESGTERFGRRSRVGRSERRSGFIPSGTTVDGTLIAVGRHRQPPRPYWTSQFIPSRDDLFPPPAQNYTQTQTDDAGATDSAQVARNLVLNITDDAGSSDSISPNEISGLALWLNAETIAQANGTAVASWSDLSTAGLTVAQATGSKQPTLVTGALNNRQVVRFDGGDALTNATSAAVTSGEFTAFVVAKETSAVNGWAVFNGNGGGYALGLNGAGTNRELLLRGQADVVGTAYTPGTAEIWEADRTATGPLSTLRVNGTSDATSAANFSAASGGLVIGAYETATASFFIGDIAEVVLYSRQLTATERAQVMRYLSGRWGIATAESASRATISKFSAFSVTQIDSAGNTDSAMNALGRGVAQTDSAGATDSATTTQSYVRTQTDDAGTTDSSVNSVGRAAVQTDDAGITDSASTSIGRGVAQTDAAGSVDSTAFSQGFGRVQTDDAGTTDSQVASQGFGRAQTDTAGSTDSTTTTGVFQRTQTDDAGTTDSATTSVGRGVTQTDSAGTTDSASFTWNRALAQTDDAGSTDDATETKTSSGDVQQTDSAGTTDAASIAVARSLAQTDDAGTTDSAQSSLGRAVSATDVAGATDAAAWSRGLASVDSAGSSDTATTSSAAARTFTDLAGSSDSAIVELIKAVAVSDSAGTTDSALFEFVESVTATDTSGTTDSAIFSVSHVLVFEDGAGTSDSAGFVQSHVLTLIDGTGSTDVASVVKLGQDRDVTVVVTIGERRVAATVEDRDILVGVGERHVSATVATQDGRTITVGPRRWSVIAGEQNG